MPYEAYGYHKQWGILVSQTVVLNELNNENLYRDEQLSAYYSTGSCRFCDKRNVGLPRAYKAWQQNIPLLNFVETVLGSVICLFVQTVRHNLTNRFL